MVTFAYESETIFISRYLAQEMLQSASSLLSPKLPPASRLCKTRIHKYKVSCIFIFPHISNLTEWNVCWNPRPAKVTCLTLVTFPQINVGLHGLLPSQIQMVEIRTI